MELTLDSNNTELTITSVKPGEVSINGERYESSLIITPEKVITDWKVASFDAITPAHIDRLIAFKPGIVILGSGEKHALLPAKLMHAFLAKGIGVECMTTAAACRTFNVLMSEGRNAVAGLII
jgi:uncharacterized protein